jgi:hypothetical protein
MFRCFYTLLSKRSTVNLTDVVLLRVVLHFFQYTPTPPHHIRHFSNITDTYKVCNNSSIIQTTHLHIFIQSSMALQLCVGPWLLLHFYNRFYTDGRTPWRSDQPVARPLPTHRKTQTQNKPTDIHALSGIRIHDPRVRVSENSSCLRPRGHRRQPFVHCSTNYKLYCCNALVIAHGTSPLSLLPIHVVCHYMDRSAVQFFIVNLLTFEITCVSHATCCSPLAGNKAG